MEFVQRHEHDLIAHITGDAARRPLRVARRATGRQTNCILQMLEPLVPGVSGHVHALSI